MACTKFGDFFTQAHKYVGLHSFDWPTPPPHPYTHTLPYSPEKDYVPHRTHSRDSLWGNHCLEKAHLVLGDESKNPPRQIASTWTGKEEVKEDEKRQFANIASTFPPLQLS